jgi:hypothetical protein
MVVATAVAASVMGVPVLLPAPAAHAAAACHVNNGFTYEPVGAPYPEVRFGETMHLMSDGRNASAYGFVFADSGDILSIDQARFTVSGSAHFYWLTTDEVERRGGWDYCESVVALWPSYLFTPAVDGAHRPVRLCLRHHGNLECSNSWYADNDDDADDWLPSPIDGTTPVEANPGSTLDPSAVPDGTVLREPDGTIAVAAGGAAFRFATWDEYLASGYRADQWSSVPSGFLSRMRTTPVDGTLLRDDGTGSISVVAGGAKVTFATWDELVAAGYGSGRFVNVPVRSIKALPNVPSNGTLVRDNASGLIAVVAGGAAVPFASPAELAAAGYPATGYVNVPRRYIDALSTVAGDGTLLRDNVSGLVAVIAGGAKFTFATLAELAAAGYPTSGEVNVPRRYIDALPAVPGDGTVLRDNATGLMAVTAGGARYTFASMTELTAAGYRTTEYVNVPRRYIDALSTVASDGTLLRDNATGLIVLVVGGMQHPFGTWDDLVAAGCDSGRFVDVPRRYIDALPLSQQSPVTCH